MSRNLDARTQRLLCLVVLSGLALFCAAMAVAAALYPGGTWFDRNTTGHRFWENFWCDLLRARGHNGAPNDAGSVVALAGWLVLSAALAAFWMLVPLAIEGRPRVGAWVRRLGLLSSVAMVGIFLTPSDAFPRLHGIAILVAGGPGILSLAFSVWALGRGGSPGLRVSGWALATFATLNFVIYSIEYGFGLPGSAVLPLIQKLATICAVVWMTLVVQRVWTPGDSP